ncbi:MAG: hypothetical protein AB7Q29_14695 [Vicinamibacterales bacterium]
MRLNGAMQLNEETRDHLDGIETLAADDRDRDDEMSPPSAADNFFYCVFVIAMVIVIAREGWYAPGL